MDLGLKNCSLVCLSLSFHFFLQQKDNYGARGESHSSLGLAGFSDIGTARRREETYTMNTGGLECVGVT